MFSNRKWLRVGLMTLVVLGLAGALLLSRATAGKPPPPPPPVKYTMTLAPIGGAIHTLEGVNNRSDLAGSVYTTEPGHVHAFVWWAPDYTSGTDLNTLLSQQQQDEGWELDFAFDINDQGQTTGIFHYRNGDPTDGVYRSHAFVYTPGQGIVALPGPWLYSRAQAINNRGEVTGAVSGIEPGVHVFVGNTRTNEVEVLDAPGPGKDINDMGQVIYHAYNANGNPHAFRYTPAQDGNPARYEDLGAIGVLKDGTSQSIANAMNNVGQVVGQSTDSAKGGYRAFRYTDGVGMVNLGTLDPAALFPQSNATSINKAGQVTGWSSYRDPAVGYRVRSFLYTDTTGMINLWPLITNPPAGVTEDDFHVGQILDPAPGFSYGRITASVGGEFCILTPDR